MSNESTDNTNLKNNKNPLNFIKSLSIRHYVLIVVAYYSLLPCL